MRINRFVAQATGVSRRNADAMISAGRVWVNGRPAPTGYIVEADDKVTLDGAPLSISTITTVMLHKPVGYVCSRNGQGAPTVYDLLPTDYHQLKPIGRLDKDSSGLLLLTNDGELSFELTHPKQQKVKIYQVTLAQPLTPADEEQLRRGVELVDGVSKLGVSGSGTNLTITMHEGRNRQVRRTFEAINHHVVRLHRVGFGDFRLEKLPEGQYKLVV